MPQTPCPEHADRHGAGVGLVAEETRPRPQLAGAPFGHGQPSDPRRSILPRGNAGWGEHGDQDCEALGYLAFVTGPNNASEMSSLMTRGTLAGPAERVVPR